MTGVGREFLPALYMHAGVFLLNRNHLRSIGWRNGPTQHSQQNTFFFFSYRRLFIFFFLFPPTSTSQQSHPSSISFYCSSFFLMFIQKKKKSDSAIFFSTLMTVVNGMSKTRHPSTRYQSLLFFSLSRTSPFV